MAAALKPKINLKNFNDKPKIESFNDMLTFETPSSGKPTELSLSSLVSFPQHKFKLYTGQQLTDMIESIKMMGVIMPLIVWHKENEYIILSGHNRANAAKLAGLERVPCVIKEDLTQEDATLIVTETNLRQRSFSDLSHSERAFCLVQHYEALKGQGKRTDLVNEIESLIDSGQGEQKARNDEKLGENYGLSRNNVARYLRIGNNLSAFLLGLFDDGEIGFLSAYALSFLDETAQKLLHEALDTNNYVIDTKKAELLRESFEDSKLTATRIVFILAGSDAKKDKPRTIKLNSKFLAKYFDEQQSQKEIETAIEEALEDYFSKKTTDFD